MTDYLRGLDAATVLTPFAKMIAAQGFSAVGRYLKSLTKGEVTAIHAAGLGLWLIFETTADRALGGIAAGKDDGAKARAQADALGAPPDVAIFATVDTDPSQAQVATVAQYHVGFQAGASPRRIGSYSCGAVLIAVEKMPATPVPWLAGAMGWNGSKAYDATGKWRMKQGPQINAGRTASWSGLSWPALPFAYDPNLIVSDADIGLWLPPDMQAPAVTSTTAPAGTSPAQPVIAIPSAIDMQRALQAAGIYKGALDGDKPRGIGWGPQSQKALADYYARQTG